MMLVNQRISDVYTAQVSTFILLMSINGPPDYFIKDNYVHSYLSSLLSSVFSSNPLLNMKWTNGQLESDNSKTYKPDLLVYNLSVNVKYILLIAEFKRSDQNSYVESDLIKLGK